MKNLYRFRLGIALIQLQTERINIQASFLPWITLTTTPINSPNKAPENAAAKTASDDNDNKKTNPPNKLEHNTLLSSVVKVAAFMQSFCTSKKTALPRPMQQFVRLYLMG